MDSDRLLYAVIGAVVTVVTSFTILSPVLGGGVAAWLADTDRRESTKLGALSGAIASVVFVPFLFIGLAIAVFDFGVALAVLFFGGLLIAAYGVGLGALGGYLAAAIREDDAVSLDLD